MPTPGERKALLFLASVAVLGAGVRAASALHSDRPEDAAAKRALERQIELVDSARKHPKKKGKRQRRSRTAKDSVARTSAPAIIDIDVASAAEIETLRWVGPKLAERIVADRDSLGPFGSIEELQRVRGIGKRLAARLAPQVTFSLLPRPSRTVNDGSSEPPRKRRSRRGESHN
ncbi:MAG TPA: helix-hairpin-helix domain-containing protein [Gemmatimonadaceae bacterium]|jgi:competence ComEA-like helix-hairpin-helix protein